MTKFMRRTIQNAIWASGVLAGIALFAASVVTGSPLASADTVGLPEHPTATSIRLSTELAERKGCEVYPVQESAREWNISYWRTLPHSINVSLQLDYKTAEFHVIAGEENYPRAGFVIYNRGEPYEPFRGGVVAMRHTKGDITADLIFESFIDHVKYAVAVHKCEPPVY